MKVVNIVPGFGGTFYCGNCLRDSAYTASLRKEGHDAIILPMYLPLTLNNTANYADTPVFYGAVNIYLKQQFPFLRNMPDWLERFLNSKPLLKFAAGKSGSTRATGLESLTESMLLGKDGFQKRELQQLVDFLKHHEKPDIIHFSNALLIGLAAQIREELGIPVVCSLQDEDVWLDAMHEDQRDHLWNLLAEKAKDVDMFIAVSQYFATVMQKKMKLPDDKLTILPIGIDLTQYEYHPPSTDPLVVGYVSRICEENGFGLLVDAFIRLKQDNRFHQLKLKATGGYTGDDKNFIKAQLDKLKEKGIDGDFEIVHHFTTDDLRQFFRTITLLSVPVLKGEAFGLYQLEALASGIPLVQPAIGAFPEIIATTGGGITYTPNHSASLATALANLLSDPASIMEYSRKGAEAVKMSYDSAKLTRQMISIYSTVMQKT
ncbi:MAG: glycosyltransferase family 4 protein [Bacteroidales bacterium]|nr:glycosyltransferase family 4 protein [Bacteroidales bacterium]